MALESQDTAIYDIAYECFSKFDHTNEIYGKDFVTKAFEMEGFSGSNPSESNRHIVRKCDFIGLRNSFIFWTEYTGTLSLRESSLDARLQDFPDIKSMFVELLEMILRNLRRLLERSPSAVRESSEDSTDNAATSVGTIVLWGDVLRAIDYALDRLHFLGSAIRKASAKRLQYNVTSYLVEEDAMFQKYATALVKRSFPDARPSLHEHLGDTIAIRRKFMVQKIRHAKKLTISRKPDANKPSGRVVDDSTKSHVALASKDRHEPRLLPTVPSQATHASKPNRQSPEIQQIHQQIHLSARPILHSTVGSTSSVYEESVEYPECPQVKDNDKYVKCPYCLKGLQADYLRDPRKKHYWQSHINEDLQPYVCLFSECAKTLVFFTHRKDWIAHMEASHSEDWTRRVHNIMWYCDVDHEPAMQFQSQHEWRAHMQKPEAHPGSHSKLPTDVQLAALSIRKQQRVLRDQHVCPLCENVPEKLQHLSRQESPSGLARILNEHIAKHLLSLSLLSLPSTDSGDADEKISIKDEKSLKRILHPGSRPQKPSEPSEFDRLSVECPSLSFEESSMPYASSEPGMSAALYNNSENAAAEGPSDSTSTWEYDLPESEPELDRTWRIILESKFIVDDNDPILAALRQKNTPDLLEEARSESIGNKQELCEYMEDNMEEYSFNGQRQVFLPQSVLNTATERAVIQRIIAQDDQAILNERDYDTLVDRAYRYGRRLFAICVYTDRPMSYLKALLDNRLTDANLPLGKSDFGASLNEKRSFIRSFMVFQKHFNTVFLTEGSMLELGDCLTDSFSIPIDYEQTPVHLKGRGAFGEVYKVKIHPDHRSFPCNTNDDDEFAMKVVTRQGREPNFHMAMKGLKHPHLVRCLASFMLGAKYHMVYELANCDLEDFIRKNKNGARNSRVNAPWLARQLAGLASALEVIHNPNESKGTATSSTDIVPQTNPQRTGYIHDIKTENILLCIYRDGKHRLGLSDFSLANVVEFASTISGKRESYKTPTKSTPIYRAPESLEGATSRPYDIWSLGCMYLELMVWFVQGYQGLEAFRASREHRLREGTDGITDEGFYFETTPGDYRLRDAVVTKIDYLSRTCDGDLKDIIRVIPELLEINPKHRITASQLAEKLKHLDTDTDSSNNTIQPRTHSVRSFASSHILTSDFDHDFGDLIKVTRPSND